MKSILNPVSRCIANVPDWIRPKKALVMLCFAIATVIFFSGIPKLKFDFTLERWLENDNAAFVAYNQFHDQFGSEDGVVLVYKPKDSDVFSQKSLELVKGILDDFTYYRADLAEGESSGLDHVVDVDCLINAFVLEVEDDVLRSTSLVGEMVPTTQKGLDAIIETAQAQKDFPLKYFSKDLKYGAIYIDTNFGAVPVGVDEGDVVDMDIDMFVDDMNVAFEDSVSEEMPRFKPTDMADYIALHEAIKKIINKPEYKEHFEFYKVGSTIDSENQVKMGEEMAFLYICALAIMLILLFVLFRSFSGVVWPLLIIVLTTIWTLGISGWAGISASPFVVLTFLLILTIGMADAVHVISNFLFFRNRGDDYNSSVRGAYEKAGIACLLTSVTTIIGLLSLCLTDLVPIKNFALMSAIGVAVAFFLTLYLLPALLDCWSPAATEDKTKSNKARLAHRIIPNLVPFIQSKLDKVVPIVERRPLAYIVPAFLVFIVCVYGASKVTINYSIYDQYAEESNFYQSIKLLDEEMAGSSKVSLYMDLGEKNALQDPEVMNVIDDMQRHLEKNYPKYVLTSSSIVHIVKDANQKLNQGREDMYVIPPTEKELSQTLFMFNTADPEERGRLVSEDYSKANITVTLKTYGSAEYRPVFENMKRDINDALAKIKHKYPSATVSVTGLFAIGMKTADYIIVTELKSFGMALVAISVVLLLIFSSLKGGLISLIPNLIPSFLALGLLGLLGIPLDFYTMMLAPIVIGIAVDDTVHFLTHYRSEVLKDGDINRSLKATIKECGQAIVFTSLILGLGFGVMSIATTPGLENLGKFGVLAVLAGLLNDLFLLPAMILFFKLRFNYQKQNSTEMSGCERVNA